MNENTLVNDVVEEVVEQAAPVAAEAATKAVAEYKITTADKVAAGGILGLAVVGLGTLGYLGYKGGKKLYGKIKAGIDKAKAEAQNDIPVAVEVVEEPKKSSKKKADAE